MQQLLSTRPSTSTPTPNRLPSALPPASAARVMPPVPAEEPKEGRKIEILDWDIT